jgi:hypothetical protein
MYDAEAVRHTSPAPIIFPSPSLPLDVAIYVAVTPYAGYLDRSMVPGLRSTWTCTWSNGGTSHWLSSSAMGVTDILLVDR